MALPEIVPRDEWLAARLRLLDEEKGRRRVQLPAGAGGGRSAGGDARDQLPLRDGERVFHTYSNYARGAEMTGGSYYFLDLTALGRQEDWEEPKGRSDSVRSNQPSFEY